jgi:uncharacterized RDD family membrane protein YckC
MSTLSPPTQLSWGRPAAAPAPAPVDLGTLDIAPLGRRAVAWLVDVSMFVGGFLVALEALGFRRHFGQIEQGLVTKSFDDGLLQLTALVALAVVFVVGWAAYRITATALWGSSVGRHLAGLRVVDAADGASRPGWAKAWGRWGVPQGLGLIPVPGAGAVAYLWAVHDRYNRGLHDKAAGTVVIRRPH